MEVDRKDVKIGEIYVGLSGYYLTIEKVDKIINCKFFTQCYYDILHSKTTEYHNYPNDLTEEYRLYDFNDCLNEEDLKPYHERLVKLIEYFESFPENKVWSRKRKLKLLEEYGK